MKIYRYLHQDLQLMFRYKARDGALEKAHPKYQRYLYEVGSLQK